MSATTSAIDDDRQTPVRDRRRFPLDAVRGLAAVLVIVWHANQNQRGGQPISTLTGLGGTVAEALALISAFAVGMFFVLSGFVLFLPWVRDGLAGLLERTGRDLLLRRCARLLPLYVVVVLLVWGITNTTLPNNWQDLALHLTMTHVYSSTYIFWTDGPAWSLAVEFHFYVLMAAVVPLLCRWCARLRTQRGRTAVLSLLPLAMVSAGTAWLLWAVEHRPVDSWPTWFGPLAMAPMFGLGMLLAVLVGSGLELRRPVVRRGLVLGAMAGLVASMALRPEHETSVHANLWNLPLGLIGAAFIAVIVMSPDPTPRWLGWRPLATLGTLSYGVYLLHEPVMRFLRAHAMLPARDGDSWDWALTTVVVVAATTAMAWLSFRYVESSGLRVLHAFEHGARPRDYYAHDIGPVLVSPTAAASLPPSAPSAGSVP